MKREFLTISNLLSIARAFLVIPFSLVMLLPSVPQRGWGTALVLLGMLTDKLDGDLARRRSEETEWGRILDPVADKICVAVVAVVLLALGDIPLWFVAALLLRDLFILLGGLYVKSALRRVLPSNAAGKWTVGIVAVTFLRAVVGVLPSLQPALIAASTAGLLLSLGMYGVRFVTLMDESRKAHGAS